MHGTIQIQHRGSRSRDQMADGLEIAGIGMAAQLSKNIWTTA